MCHCVGRGKLELVVQELWPSVRAKASHSLAVGSTILALAVVCMLSGCGTSVTRGSGGLASGSDTASELGARSDTELGRKLNGQHQLIVANTSLNVGWLQQFYARHNFQPVWENHQAQANALIDAIMRTGDQGLDPDWFHARLLRQNSELSSIDRDLLLSDAFLSYADALARGVVPPERRGDDEVLTPEPISVAAAVDDALTRPDPAAEIDALAPTTPTYKALLQALKTEQSRNVIDGSRLRTIVVNLERQRWLPRQLPADRVWVNVADERLVSYRANNPVFSTRVVVGEDVKINQSPEFSTKIDAVFYNPPWVIPRDIAAKEILPKAKLDPNYLATNHMVALPCGEVEQLPGPDAGLGFIMFDMPNHFDVYLHDTPDRDIFSRTNRRLSHGCIRVQHPRELAALLMSQPISEIDAGIEKGDTTRNDLPVPVAVFVVYETAFVDTHGTLQFRPDFYRRDAAIWNRMQRSH
jgi:L,D-transpeptidase YcbB